MALMMWLNFWLLIVSLYHPGQYWEAVAQENLNGCTVLNTFFVSCAIDPPPFAIPIPPDAIVMVAPWEAPKPGRRLN
jgi:hypothetical protein